MLLFLLTFIDDTNDEGFFTEIYKFYGKQMWFKANEIIDDKQLAEDAVQNAFIGIAKNIKTVRGLDKNAMRTYLLTAAKNAAIDLLKKTRNEIVSDALADNISDTSNDNTATIDENDYILHILDIMPHTYRDVLYYYLVLDMSEKAIANTLHLNINTVRQRISRGRKLFAQFYEKEMTLVEA